MGPTDVDHLSTTSTYLSAAMGMLQLISRQLVSYPSAPHYAEQTVIVPDLATVVPTRENGGISADGRTYTFHLRSGAMWDTHPARAIVAADEVRAILMLCNPVSPTGAPMYYTSTIVGLADYCTQFARVPGTPAAIRDFVSTHTIAGVEAPNDSTVVFHLVQPASDFLNLLSMSFASPLAVEMLDYVPDGPEYRSRFVSSGPYRVASYLPNRGILFTRNPAWDPAADPLHKAYPDSVQIIEGVESVAVQQQLEAGAADLEWMVYPSSVDLASLVPLKDPNLIIGPEGDYFSAAMLLGVNFIGPNQRGALRQLGVRQALEYAVDHAAAVQVYGGPLVARPLAQPVAHGSSGYRDGYDPYPTPGGRGDAARARTLLAAAGYPDGLTLKLLFMNDGASPRIAQSLQASMARAGVRLELLPATIGDFYGKYLASPDNARRGVWDLALFVWLPDWYGAANGRSVIGPLFDGRQFGPNSNDFGDFNDPTVNAAIDAALAAPSLAAAEHEWQAAATATMEQAGVIPLIQTKYPIYHSARVHDCYYEVRSSMCDLNVVWLRGARGARRQLAASPPGKH